MPLSNPARREQFVAIPKPTEREMGALQEALFWVGEALREQMEDIDRPDYDPESPMCTAEAFAAVSKLLTDLRFAKPVEKPEPTLPVAVLVPGIRVIRVRDEPAGEAAKRKPTKALAKKGRFDFAALPPRVEAGC